MDYLVSVLTFGVIWAILVLSLDVLVGYAGQVSLGHAAFFGIGAYAAAILSTRHQLPSPAVIAAAVLITALVGAFLGLPSLRVRHDFLVLATIGLNFVVVGTFAYADFFGGALGIVGIPLPEVGGMTLRGPAYLALCLGALAVAAWAAWSLPRTWGGLGLLTIREDEVAAASVGVGHARYKIAAFALSGGLAGLGGALYAPFVGNVFPARFGFIESIVLMSMLVFGGMGTVRGAILGGLVLKSLPEYLRFASEYRFALYGGILVLMMLLQPQGLLGEDSWLWKRTKRLVRTLRPGREAGSPDPAPRRQGDGDRLPRDGHTLRVEGVSVTFDGLQAVDGVTLEVRSGEILGLIGPNGAGKTTLFNAIVGQVPLSEGRVLLDDREIQGLAPHRVAARGVGRTFQVVRPFRRLDVGRNVLAGLGIDRYRRAPAFLEPYRAALPRAAGLAARVGLGARLSEAADGLPIGLLRRLEIARAVATGPDFVLLDEPAAGLTHQETTELAGLVRELAEEGRGIILVEHNMRFAMGLCDRIVVLSAGRVLAQGPPARVREDPKVIETYLGRGS